MRRGRHGRVSTRRLLVRCTAGAVLFCVLMAGCYAAGRWLENRNVHEQRGVMSDGFGQVPVVEYQGNTYARKLNMTTILLMGVDQSADAETVGFRQGGQADFLMLLVLDHDAKTVRQLQIDRDTIAQVVTLGVLGNVVGTRDMQICLAHGFGATREENCKYTVQAVENLLEGIDIHLYLALQLDAIDVFNDALGGVTVTLEDDFSAYDPQMTAGTTLTLHGSQAEAFVRSRMEVGDGSNASRMRRQQAYLSAAGDLLREKLAKDPNFIGEVYDQVSGAMTTSMSRGRMINEANRAYQYDILPVETLAGEYKIGEDGFMEFHADEDALLVWTMETFFILKE